MTAVTWKWKSLQTVKTILIYITIDGDYKLDTCLFLHKDFSKCPREKKEWTTYTVDDFRQS